MPKIIVSVTYMRQAELELTDAEFVDLSTNGNMDLVNAIKWDERPLEWLDTTITDTDDVEIVHID